MKNERTVFYSVLDLVTEVQNKLAELSQNKEIVDYLTFVADGEPTLDINLGKIIRALKSFGVKNAVITNSSLMIFESTRQDLLEADWVSVKVDAISPQAWKKINRPIVTLNIVEILEGIRQFSSIFKGRLNTETMLVQGINDSIEEIELVAKSIQDIHPQKAFLSIPIRPPAESNVHKPSEFTLTSAYNIFQKHGIPVEYLIAYEGDEFIGTGDAEKELLNITSVHPMRQSAVEKLFQKYRISMNALEKLVHSGRIVRIEYQNDTFYMRNLRYNK